MKIVFIIEQLKEHGGAQRAFTTIANYRANKSDVVVCSFDPIDANSFYELNSKIKWLKIKNLSNKVFFRTIRILPIRFIRRCFQLRNELLKEKPDVVISFMDFTNIFSTIVCRNLQIPVIISDRANPVKKKKLTFFWGLIRKLIYPYASTLVLQTEGIVGCYSKRIQKIVKVIPNPILLPEIERLASNFADKKPFIAGVGRLHNVKGFDLLIKAFSHIVKKYPLWKLVILGEGDERSSLEKLINENSLDKHVFLEGVVENPQIIIQQADIFAFPSRWEGFPNALGEAMALGLPVISANCDFGPSEIITDGEDGLLIEVENVDQLENSIERLIQDEHLRTRLGTKAKDVIKRFNIETIMSEWDDAIHDVI